jgi:16S rRNA (cytosine1402-N4)-methyltransferase
MSGVPHIPVLLDEVMAALAPAPGSLLVDATFGAGGYTRRLLDASATVHAFDRDPEAIAMGRQWPEAGRVPPRLVLHPCRFSAMVEALGEAGISRVDGVVMDIGVSSMESEIADVLYRYGEERQSRRVARAIVAARPLDTTGELARTVRKALGYRPGAPKDPATRSFQAIRIHVNAEFEELEAGLNAAEHLLASGGRLAVVSFHSLEDRIVKQFLREASAASAATSRHLPEAPPRSRPSFTHVAKAVRPSAEEIARNPRARSATLRSATRTDAPARERKAA